MDVEAAAEAIAARPGGSAVARGAAIGTVAAIAAVAAVAAHAGLSAVLHDGRGIDTDRPREPALGVDGIAGEGQGAADVAAGAAGPTEPTRGRGSCLQRTGGDGEVRHEHRGAQPGVGQVRGKRDRLIEVLELVPVVGARPTGAAVAPGARGGRVALYGDLRHGKAGPGVGAKQAGCATVPPVPPVPPMPPLAP